VAIHDREASVVAGDDAPAAARPRWWWRIGQGLEIFNLWLVVAIAITWPLAGSLRTHHLLSWWGTPFDLYQGAWAMAWQTDLLFSGRQTALAHANIFVPETGALFYGQTGWGAMPLFAPIYLPTHDPTLAINMTLLLGLALTALGVHLVVRRWTGSTVAGAVAAATFVTNPWVSRWFVPTAPQLAALMWMPWIALLASVRPFRTRHMLSLAFLVALQSLTDVVYVTPALLAAVGTQALICLVRRESRADGLRLAASLGLAVLALCPLLLPFVDVVVANPKLASQSAWRGGLSQLPFFSTHPVYLAPITALLVAAGLVCRAMAARDERRRATRPWATAATWTIVGVAISLPPLIVAGGWTVPMPLGLLHLAIPATAAIRGTARLGVVGLMGVAFLAGLAFAEVQRVLTARTHDRTLIAVTTGAVVLLYLATLAEATLSAPPISWPRTLVEAPTVPPSFSPFLHSTGKPVLQLPVGYEAISPGAQAVAMYRSIGRWYPLVNGYASYWPAGFERRMRVARHLPDPKATAELVRSTGIGFIWVDGAQLRWPDLRRWRGLRVGDGSGLFPVARNDDSVLYMVTPRR
jgi:hypothetical protein